MSALLLLLGLVLFVGLVLIHEWGHFIAARRNGVDVEEFGLGFPPRIKTLTKHKGTAYTLNLLPLGGFVRLKGEHDMDKAEGSYGAATLKTKIKIMLAGVTMNLIVAIVLLTLLALIGMPKLIDNQFTVASDTKVVQQQVLAGYVDKDSPASKVGVLGDSGLNPEAIDRNQSLQARDQILSMEGLPAGEVDERYDPAENVVAINSAQDLREATKRFAGQWVVLDVDRGGERHLYATKLLSDAEVEASRDTDNPKGYLGVVPTEFTLQRSTWSAPIVGVGLAKQFTELTFKGLGSAMSGLAQGDTQKASEQVSGPVGIFVVLKEGSSLGLRFILMIVAIISLTLAIMNVLPIPALDGGRLFVTLVYRAIKRPLTPQIEERIHGTGFAVLMALFVLITVVDVRRFF